MNDIDKVKEYLLALQNRLCAELEQLDGKETFARDGWERPDGGEEAWSPEQIGQEIKTSMADWPKPANVPDLIF